MQNKWFGYIYNDSRMSVDLSKKMARVLRHELNLMSGNNNTFEYTKMCAYYILVLSLRPSITNLLLNLCFPVQ